MDAIIVDKSDGSQHRQSVTGLQLDEASVVKLPIAPESVVSFEQNGNDLLIVMASGETIVIGDFFIDFDDERNELILVDDDGIAWWGQYSGPWSDFAFAEIGADGVAPFPFAALGGLGAAAAGGLAFGAGGGSEDAASVFPVVDVQDIADDPAGDRVTVRGSSTGDYVVVSYPDENGNIVTSDPIAVDEDGNWSYDLPRDNIAEGDVDVIGTVTDENGNPVQDENGNPISDSETANLDLTGPTVAVDIENDGQSGTVTFTFSEAVTGFGMSDVSVNNGTLSNLTQVDDHTWTATVTPAATGDVSVEVTEGSYTDLAGNAGTQGSDTAGFDRTAPTVDVVITDNGQDGELVLTFSPDTDRDSFDPSVDLVLDNADLGTDGTWSEDGDGNQVWTVTITPTGTGEVTATVTDGSYLDTDGNAGEEGSDTEVFDVDGPSVIVDIENNGQSGTVTFTFSEAVTGFAASDVSVGNGTLSGLTQVDDHTWTATVTPAATGDVSVEVTEGSYTDLAGNAGTKGSDTEGFDRTAPTVDVVITDNGQDGELVLTFSPDTDRDSFDPSVDLVLDNADLGTDGTWSEDGDGNQVWTVTITPTGTGEVTATVTDGSYLDTAGNAGEEGSDTENFDVAGPSVVVDIENNGQSGTVTFTFSEAVTGFAASDVSVGNGTLSGLTQVDDHTWTATVTPEKAGGDVSVTVGEDSYADLAGNLGSSGTDTEAFDRYEPLAEGDHSSLTLAGDDFKSDENFNVAFVLDFSGSVNNSEADQMLQAVKAAGQAFFEGTTGDVQIQLVAFSSDAQSTVSFSNYADFAAQIAAWENQRPYNGGTDYTAAVDKTMEAFQPLDDYNNRVFFMSDGEPTEQTTQHWNGSNWVVDHSLDSDTENAWNEFVANNNIDVQTVGIGQGVTVPRLQDVDEADGDNHVIQVSNFDDLVDDLLDVIREVDVAGNVLNGNDGIAGTADDDLLGVDGGRILSIAVDGEVYTYDLSGITDSNGGAVADGSILNVETDQGGRLVFDFETGDWTYTANPDTATGTETFDYVLTDDSGDTSSATLTIDVEAAPEAATMSFDAETSGAGEDASVFTMAAADLSVATLGLSAVDEATADDDSASSQPEDAADIALDDLVYEDSGESLDAYLPEESVSIASSAETAASPSDSGATASLSLDEIENHAALVG